MTAHPQDRERLAKLLHAEYEKWNRGEAVAAWTGPLADALLAAGVTLPHAPKPTLLTDQQVGELWDRIMVPLGYISWESHAPGTPVRVARLAFARAAAEEAIRGRILGRLNTFGYVELRHKDGHMLPVHVSRLLDLFGLEGE